MPDGRTRRVSRGSTRRCGIEASHGSGVALVAGKLVFGLALALALDWTAPIREEAALPADAEAAADRLAASPRHGEWIEFSEGQGASGGWHDTVRA